MLHAITCQELEAVAQTVAVANQCTQPERGSSPGQSQFQGGDFSRFQLSGESYPDSILTQFNRPTPKFYSSFGSEHFHRHAYVQLVPWITAQFLWVSSVCGHARRGLVSRVE